MEVSSTSSTSTDRKRGRGRGRTKSGSRNLAFNNNVKVLVTLVKSVALVKQFNTGSDGYARYEYVWPNKSQQVLPLLYDFGFIMTETSDLSEQNNCEQYSVSGVCDCNVGIYPGMKAGSRTLFQPIDITKAGESRLEWFRTVAGQQQKAVLTVNVLEATASYSVVSEKLDNYFLYNGSWRPGGGFSGNPTKYWKPAFSSFVKTDCTLDESAIHRALQRKCLFVKYFMERVASRIPKTFGDLAQEAASSIRSVDINSIAYIRDFIEIGKLTRSIASVADPSALETLKSSLRTAAGFYLGNHYGTRLTIKDTEKIADAIDKLELEHAYQTMGALDVRDLSLHGREYHCQRRLTAKVRNVSDEILHVTDSVQSAIDQLTNRIKRIGYELDIAPTAANLWDLIPYSFVVDWFLPIGNYLEARESRNYMETLPVQSVFMTDKFEWSEDLQIAQDNFNLHAPLFFKYYRRSCEWELPLPRLHVDTPKGAQSHWLEATAIILQNATRR